MQGHVGARGHGPPVTVAMRCEHSERHWQLWVDLVWSDLIRSGKMRLQGCRGQEGRRDAWSEGGWKRDGGKERAERERKRERERRGPAQWPVVSVGLHGPVGVAARAVAGVCRTHLLKHRHRHRQWCRRRHMGVHVHARRTDTDTHAQRTDACRCSVAMVKLEVVHFMGKGISRDSAQRQVGMSAVTVTGTDTGTSTGTSTCSSTGTCKGIHTRTRTRTRMLRSEQVGGSMHRVTLQGGRGGRG